MKFKYLLFFWVTGMALLNAACFDDKGNYSYSPVNELEIIVEKSYPVLANADTIKVFPKIVSSLEGEILPSDPNYTYQYRAARLLSEAGGSEGALFVMDSSFSRDLIIPAKLEAGKYNCWLDVKDIRTEVVTTAAFTLEVSSVTREGWMVLCDEGEDNRVRLDMIARISDERYVQTFDILYRDLPDLHQAYSLAFFQDAYNIDDFIYLLSGSGAYQLDAEYLTSGQEYDINYEFAQQTEKRVPSQMAVTYGYRFIVDQNQNGYAMENSSGSIYELPVNTETPGSAPEFKLAPYIGIDRSAGGNRCPTALLYDVDHKRFMQWNERVLNACYPIPDPEGALFSYTTGKDLVYMESTNNDKTIYSILKDTEGKYYIYGISMTFSWTATIIKQVYYGEINATNIGQATAFAFHSSLPYLFYAIGGQLYQYDLYQKKPFSMFSYESETITMLKFNPFINNYWYSSRPDSFKNIPNNLIIGTEDEKVKNENKGVLRFYEVPPLNGIPTLIGEPYRGFGKIRDVVYRERN